MKTAIYIEDGVVQLVLTPESDFEKSVLDSFQEKELETQIFSGSFYDCRGGWVRQKDCVPNRSFHAHSGNNDKSLILKTSQPNKKNPEGDQGAQGRLCHL